MCVVVLLYKLCINNDTTLVKLGDYTIPHHVVSGKFLYRNNQNTRFSFLIELFLQVVLFASSVLSLPLAPENDFELERRGNEGFNKRSAQSADYEEYDGQDQVAVASSSGGQIETRVPSEGFDLSKFLGAAEAQPLRAEGHEVVESGRR